MNPYNTVVPLYMRFNDTALAIGTGILYRRHEKAYIVTAWHNLSGRNPMTMRPLSDSKSAIPNNVEVNIPFYVEEVKSFFRTPYYIPLENSKSSLYLIHPQTWPKVDIAAIPIDPDQLDSSQTPIAGLDNLNICDLLKEMLVKALEPELPSNSPSIPKILCIQEVESKLQNKLQNDLFASDEIFILGYPKGITDLYGQPIWKRETVASAPHLNWQGQKQFLVDCASREGMSGAPAIFYHRGNSITIGNNTYHYPGPHTVFHGIYSGRLGKTSEFEAQIGIIWRRELVDEIIDNRVYAPLSQDLILSNKEISIAIEKIWSTDLKFSPEKILESEPHLFQFCKVVMKEIEGRAYPDDVKEIIIGIAKNKKYISALRQH